MASKLSVLIGLSVASGGAACLEKDSDVLLTFYDFPAEHWKHLRSTNPVKSTFARVRLRTTKTKAACRARRP